MASTVCKADIPEELLPVLVLLVAAESGLVSPDTDGYVVTAGDEAWEYEFTVPEACVGIYRAEFQDGDGLPVAQGYIWIEADTVGPFFCDSSFSTLLMAKRITVANVVAGINANATQITLQTNAATAATEVVKIHRSASPLTAGGNATRTKISASETEFVETIS